MSDRNNDEWLEACKETFDDAIVQEDWLMAKAVIEDVKEAGFRSQARTLEDLLSESQTNL